MAQYCPSCGVAWVPGETTCPFCGAGLGGGPPAGGGGFQLQWVGANGVPRSQPIPAQGLRLGRGPGNNVILDDSLVSREHAVFWVQGDTCYVRDEGSTNGTLLNGQRIGSALAVRPGDRVTIGETVLTLVAAMAAPAAWPGPGAVPAPLPGAYPPAPAAPVPARAPVGSAMPVPASRTTPFGVGRGITLAGVLAILLMFFMPWVSCTSGFGDVLTVSGYDIATTPTAPAPEDMGWDVSTGYAGQSQGVPPAVLFLVPGIGLVVLALALAGLFAGRGSQTTFLVAQLLLVLVAAGVLVWFYLDYAQIDPEWRPFIRLDVGYWGSWVAVLLMAVGAILDIAGVGNRPPAKHY